jgi:hypothetical protein
MASSLPGSWKYPARAILVQRVLTRGDGFVGGVGDKSRTLHDRLFLAVDVDD